MENECITYVVGNESLFDEIQGIWNQLVNHHYNNSSYFKSYFKGLSFKNKKEDLINLAKEGEVSIILAKNSDNKTIGYCVSSVLNSIGEVSSICIDKNYRKQGIGDSLMEKSLKWLRSKKVNNIFLNVSVGNEEVFSFYEKHGFYPRSTKLQLKD